MHQRGLNPLVSSRLSRVARILPRATVQLYEASLWWATNRSVAQAARWLAEIEGTIQGLSDTAPRHPLARESDAFDFSVHQCNFGVLNKPAHRILYSFDNSQVLVYSVRHLSQSDLPPDEIA